MTIIAECNGRGIGVRHITIDLLGQIFEVPAMFDKFGEPTLDPALASTCVVFFANQHLSQDADLVPIYTVH